MTYGLYNPNHYHYNNNNNNNNNNHIHYNQPPTCFSGLTLKVKPLRTPDQKPNQEAREKQRVKQVAIGKATQGYMNYIKVVPKELRDPVEHLHTPSTSPRTLVGMSKRQFHGELKAWRKYLHKFDDISEFETSETTENIENMQPTNFHSNYNSSDASDTEFPNDPESSCKSNSSLNNSFHECSNSNSNNNNNNEMYYTDPYAYTHFESGNENSYNPYPEDCVHDQMTVYYNENGESEATTADNIIREQIHNNETNFMVNVPYAIMDGGNVDYGYNENYTISEDGLVSAGDREMDLPMLIEMQAVEKMKHSSYSLNTVLSEVPSLLPMKQSQARFQATTTTTTTTTLFSDHFPANPITLTDVVYDDECSSSSMSEADDAGLYCTPISGEALEMQLIAMN